MDKEGGSAIVQASPGYERVISFQLERPLACRGNLSNP